MDKKKILLISFGHLSCDINGGALPALLPYLAAAHNFDYQTCGSLAFAYAAMSSIIQPVFGFIADRIARSWFIPLGILLAGCGLSLVGFFQNYWAIFIALLICGTGGAIFHPEGARYANIISGHRKGVGISIFSVGGNSGFVMGPLVVAFAVGGVSLGSLTLGGFGLPGTAAFAFLACFTAATLYWCITQWNIAERTAAPKAHTVPTGNNDWGAFAILSGVIITRSVLFLSFNTYLPLYWQSVFGQSAQTGSAILAFFCVIGVTSNILGGMAADRWGFRTIIRYSSFFTLPFILAFPFTQNIYVAFALLVPIALGLYAPFSSMIVLGQRYLARNMGFASGITLGVAMSIGGLMTPVLGRIADTYGGLATAFHTLAVVAVIGAMSSLFLKKSAKEQ